MGKTLIKLSRYLGSIKLTVALLFCLFFLILFGTFSQVDIGIYESNKKYFTSWFVWLNMIPIYLGGYSIGLLLVINILCSHASSFQFKRSKIGIFLIHFGIVLLIIGAALTSWFGHEMQVAIKEGEQKNYVEYPTTFELVLINTKHPTFDTITNFSLSTLAKGPVTIESATITLNTSYPNAYLSQRGIVNKKYDQLGETFKLISLPKTYKMSEQNIPGLDISIHESGDIYHFILWGGSSIYQNFSISGTPYFIKLRPKRQYLPFKIKLNDFAQQTYTKSNTALSFNSNVSILSDTGSLSFDISMNSPLRYDGYTFFQSSFTEDEQTSVFQVVKNPSWLIPYVSSFLITLGLLIQMIQSSRRKSS